MIIKQKIKEKVKANILRIDLIEEEILKNIMQLESEKEAIETQLKEKRNSLMDLIINKKATSIKNENFLVSLKNEKFYQFDLSKLSNERKKEILEEKEEKVIKKIYHTEILTESEKEAISKECINQSIQIRKIK